jgi:hypothetical protein
MAKRTSLTTLSEKLTKKDAPAVAAQLPPEANLVPVSRSRNRDKGLYVEVDADTRRALKGLAVELDTTVKSLVLDGINEVFRKNGKPPIATGGDA